MDRPSTGVILNGVKDLVDCAPGPKTTRFLVPRNDTNDLTLYSAPRLVRIQEKGQVTLPAEVRKRLGLKKGDLVAVVAIPDGVLIMPQEIIATKALDQIVAILKEQGLSLEELIEAGRGEREALLRELYGIDPASQPK